MKQSRHAGVQLKEALTLGLGRCLPWTGMTLTVNAFLYFPPEVPWNQPCPPNLTRDFSRADPIFLLIFVSFVASTGLDIGVEIQLNK